MSKKAIRTIDFDMDVHKLGEVFEPYNQGYGVIKSIMKDYGYNNNQGSHYVSLMKKDNFDAMQDLAHILERAPWIAVCQRQIRMGIEEESKNAFIDRLIKESAETFAQNPEAEKFSSETTDKLNAIMVREPLSKDEVDARNDNIVTSSASKGKATSSREPKGAKTQKETGVKKSIKKSAGKAKSKGK